MNPETLLVSSVIVSGEIGPALHAGLEPEHFRLHSDQWEWLLKQHKALGHVPDSYAFVAQWPEFVLINTTDVAAHAHAVGQNHAKHRLVRLTSTLLDMLKDGEIDRAMTTMGSELMSIQASFTDINDSIDVVREWTELYDMVEEKVDKVRRVGMAGIPTGWQTLDLNTGGLQSGWLCVIGGRLGHGKELSNSTMVLTPDGWRRNGDLRTGDMVTGSDGQPTIVTGVYPQGRKRVYEVEFNDGSVIRAGAEHLWTTRIGTKTWSVRSTAEIMEHLARGRQRPAVPTMQAWRRPTAVLPMEPYKLGLLLGDGGFTNAVTFSCKTDKELLASFGDSLKVRSNGQDYGVSGVAPILRDMGLLGLKSHEKHIPQEYLYASVEQRHAILQGLLDTDGGTTYSGGVEFSSTSQALASGVQFLAESLGGHAHWHERQTYYTYKGERKPGRWSYRLMVVLPEQYPPFRLKRKADAWVPRTKYQPCRTIRRVTPLDEYEGMTCISVDAADSLYVTEHCIVTHNTYVMLRMACEAVLKGHTALYFSLEQSRHQIGMRASSILGRMVGTSTPLRSLDMMRGTITSTDDMRLAMKEVEAGVPGTLLVNDTSRGRIGTMQIASAIEQYKPDICFVDYLTLLTMTTGDGDWRSVAALSADLKRIAERYEIPVVVGSQLNRSAIGQEAPDPGNIAQADAVGQDADLVVMLTRPSTSVLRVSLGKNRHGPDGLRWNVRFRPGVGDLTEVSGDDAARLQAEDQEQE